MYLNNVDPSHDRSRDHTLCHNISHVKNICKHLFVKLSLTANAQVVLNERCLDVAEKLSNAVVYH